MRRMAFVVAGIALILALGATQADALTCPYYAFSFEWLRDADGDGIPNHIDGDWVPPLDGTGYQNKIGSISFYLCPAPTGDQDQDRDRIRQRDRTGDRLHDCDRDQLRLRDGSCR